MQKNRLTVGLIGSNCRPSKAHCRPDTAHCRPNKAHCRHYVCIALSNIVKSSPESSKNDDPGIECRLVHFLTGNDVIDMPNFQNAGNVSGRVTNQKNQNNAHKNDCQIVFLLSSGLLSGGS